MGLFNWLFGARRNPKYNDERKNLDTRLKPKPTSQTKPSQAVDTSSFPPPARLLGGVEEDITVNVTRVDGDWTYEDTVKWSSFFFPDYYRAARRPQTTESPYIFRAEIKPTGKAAENLESAIYDHLSDFDEFSRDLADEDDEREMTHSLALRKSGDHINVVHVWEGWEKSKSTVIGRLEDGAAKLLGDRPLRDIYVEIVEARTSSDDKGRPLMIFTIDAARIRHRRGASAPVVFSTSGARGRGRD